MRGKYSTPFKKILKEIMKGLELWHNRLGADISYGNQFMSWIPNFPARGLAKAIEDGSGSWAPAPTWVSRGSIWLLALVWLNSSCCGHLGSEPVDEESLSLLLIK